MKGKQKRHHQRQSAYLDSNRIDRIFAVHTTIKLSRIALSLLLLICVKQSDQNKINSEDVRTTSLVHFKHIFLVWYFAILSV